MPRHGLSVSHGPLRVQLQGISLFTRHKYQCQSSRYAPHVQQMIQQGLASAEGFLASLTASYDEYWHDVGVPRHISVLYVDLANVWDFEQMCQRRLPEEQHLHSLDRVYKAFAPRLAFVRWPQSPAFSYVSHVWPTEKEMRRQYKVLWRQVHLNQHRDDWRSPVQCRVCLVQPPSMLLTLLGRKLQERSPMRRAIKAVDISCSVFLIATFLYTPPTSFQVRAESLAPLQQGAHLQSASFAIMKKAPFKRQLLFVLDMAVCLEPAAVVATFCLEQTIHQYTSEKDGRHTHCWHAAFLMSVSATSQGASSVCERVGSLLHGLEGGETVIHPARVADRLRITVAQIEATVPNSNHIYFISL